MFKTLSSSPMSRYFALWVSLFLIATPSVAQVKNEDTPTRPKVAVVLAGGGAKGAAHIGVLKALEEMHIPVDIITGTSMGAYVGGLYATGMSADEIESFIYSVDWNSGYRDRVDRSQRRVRDKEYEDRYQITTDLGLRFGEVRAPTGVVQGQNMLRVLRETTGNLGRFESFDELAIPYRSVATDILELDEVVIGNGYLVDAMMASMSVPGALPPYKLNGHMLVDGGVVNNMPVDVARAMGADVVIAVDISTDYKTEDDFTGLFTVADQLSNYLVRRSTQQQVETLQEHDVYIRPNVGQMETVEFDKMPWAFQSGYDITKEMESKLAGLLLSNAEYQKYIDHKQEVRKKLVYGDDRVVDEIVIVNNTHYSDVLLTNRLELETGRKIETAEIEKAVENLYALDRFELITYHFEEVDGSNLLVFDVNEKSWGPNYLNFRFFLEDDFDTDSQYGIGMSTNFTNLNSHGAEMALNVEMGTDKLIEAELYSPVLSSQEFFVAGKVAYSSEGRNLPVSDDDSSLSSVNDFLPVSYTEFVSEIAIGIQPTLWQELRLGGRYSSGSIELSTLASVGNLDFERRGLFANYRLDTLDDFAFPTRGLLVDLEYLVSHDTSPEEIGQSKPKDIVEDTVYEIDARFKGAMSYQRHTLVGQAEYSFVQSKNSSITLDPRELGGFLHLSGIPRNSLIGQNLFFSSLVYRYKWFDNDFGLFEAPVYVGASLEHGGTWSDNDLKLNEAPLYNAASIFFGVDSPIGPIMLAYGRTEQDMEAVYLIVGTSFK
ncbi:TPA: patatin-like phospholipase family protein [Vibrio parahaemolyticus]|uniref:patatin-like phospholipase family protein n=1 Tax=Vibrio parahaemolyticus TaxID=670 RepID=UPI00146C62FA|nr:patatin-like phospholipase family protein [Vibrio parahaemolyticus]MDF4696110.1 patatin-like phospholipase family protein [Vibrio parahaemolyticus]MDF4721731.1 patatin-like phospholipase family protein [Vibrio parahaemolyticus]MDF5023732.1 patatin-like phospholipase family protein [Vibrio parahaemolyticus]MDF5043068.1 patatin-like phospholipase family protein [Vibrio parahaemolyticus]MDF5046306.1 patatin-like phospholipase family protein [Vibrio parahaemolyticus]